MNKQYLIVAGALILGIYIGKEYAEKKVTKEILDEILDINRENKEKHKKRVSYGDYYTKIH